MITFFVALAALIVCYCTYGLFVTLVFKPDDRRTPCQVHPDGVDYVPLPIWRAFLIQLLNIAGLGPIFGALSGAIWGPSVYLWIVLGTIFAGAVHDYLSGMLSMRNDGASISELTGMYLGPTMKTVMRIFSVVLLVMIGVVFMVGPAQLLSRMIMGAGRDFNLPRTAAVSIQACYVTRQSVDKMPSVAKAKKAIRKAFENCQLKKGTSVVEFVSTCNTGRNGKLMSHIHGRISYEFLGNRLIIRNNEYFYK